MREEDEVMHAAFIRKDKGHRRKKAWGVLVNKQGQEKISADIQRHPDVAVRGSEKCMCLLFLDKVKKES